MNLFKRLFKRKVKPTKQTLWCWCPGCKKDLVSSKSFVKDTDFVYYKCTNCGTESKWDFDTYGPVVVLVEPKEVTG